MCPASHLANRELYITFLRLISAFRIVPAGDTADRPILDPLECNNTKTGLTLDPKKFKVGFRVRNQVLLDEWIRKSDERTKDL